MGKLETLLQAGFGNDLDLNCAEKLLYGANWAYNLHLSPESLKLAAGFGGGMGIESSCGAMTGAIMVLSHLFVERNSHESDRIKKVEAKFITAFRQQLGALDCKELKAAHRTEQEKCNKIIFLAGKLLDEIIEAEQKKLD